MTVEYFSSIIKGSVSAEPSPRAKMELLFEGTHFAQIIVIVQSHSKSKISSLGFILEYRNPKSKISSLGFILEYRNEITPKLYKIYLQ